MIAVAASRGAMVGDLVALHASPNPTTGSASDSIALPLDDTAETNDEVTELAQTFAPGFDQMSRHFGDARRVL